MKRILIGGADLEASSFLKAGGEIKEEGRGASGR